jgi:hypothetical protein
MRMAYRRACCCTLLSGIVQCMPVAWAQPAQPAPSAPSAQPPRVVPGPDQPAWPGSPDPERGVVVPSHELPRWHLDAPRRPRAELIEVPSTTLLGKPSRPHHALGFQSELMQRWTRELGLDTERCMAPMLRMYTRVGRSASPTTRASSDLQSTFWVQARCSLR